MKSMEVSVKSATKKGSDVTVKTKKKKHLGHLTIDETQLPQVKDWDVGQEYEIVIKVRQTAIREVDKWDIEEYGYSEGQVKADFEIVSARVESAGEEKSEKYEK